MGRLVWLILCGLFSLGFSWTFETRRSTLVPWNDVGESTSTTTARLGWIEEQRNNEKKSYQVNIGWESNEASLSVEIPYVDDAGSLASNVWPAALAGAILCQSPAFKTMASQRDMKTLELGTGLGLVGHSLAKATSPSEVCLTDKSEEIIQLVQRITANEPTVSARCLEWRDHHEHDQHSMDIVLGSDIAYYFYLLRPLMNTAKHFLKPSASLLLLVGQANRESQWDLYDNISMGSYNQETSEKEDAWPGKTEMLLYKLEMQEWQRQKSVEGQIITEAHSRSLAGVVPIAILVHQSPGLKMGPLTRSDYVAESRDRDALSMSF